jgi:hypothetical protein
MGQHLHGRGGPLVAGKANEAPPGKCHHSAEDVQARFNTPVDDEHLARCPNPGASALVVVGTPRPLGLGDQAPEVAGRPRVTGCSGFWQQALGRDASRGAGDPLGDDIGDDVEVVMARGPCRATLGAFGEHGPLHCLVVHSADGCGAPVAADVVVRGDHVHTLPLRLQWSVLRVAGADWVPTPWPPGGLDLVDA